MIKNRQVVACNIHIQKRVRIIDTYLILSDELMSIAKQSAHETPQGSMGEGKR